jgi:AcrR family transcriptional regulator
MGKKGNSWMGRPSKAAERIEQVMDATRVCLRQYGLAGTTLERVAEQSGLSRSHIHHYVGNRDALLRAFADWLFAGYEQALVDVAAEGAPEDRLEGILEYLFGSGFLPVNDDDAAIRELMAAGLADEALRTTLQARHRQGVAVVARAMREATPAMTAKQARTLAYGVWCLAIGNSTLAEIELKEASGRLARRAADSLVWGTRADD